MPVANAVRPVPHRVRRAADTAERQPDEDRRAGDRPRESASASYSCKANLTRPVSKIAAWPPDNGSTSTSRTIYFLAFPIGEYRPVATGSQTIASRVAEMLGVSRASAGEMLKRLEAEGLVERGEHKEAILTPAGGRAGAPGRPQAPRDRAVADGFHGVTRPQRRMFTRRDRRNVQRRHGRTDRGQAGVSRSLPPRLADRPGRRASREPRARAALRPRAGTPRQRSSGWPSTTATCSTGSTTRAWRRDARRAAGRRTGGRANSGSRSTASRRQSATRRPPGCSSSATG